MAMEGWQAHDREGDRFSKALEKALRGKKGAGAGPHGLSDEDYENIFNARKWEEFTDKSDEEFADEVAGVLSDLEIIDWLPRNERRAFKTNFDLMWKWYMKMHWIDERNLTEQEKGIHRQKLEQSLQKIAMLFPSGFSPN